MKDQNRLIAEAFGFFRKKRFADALLLLLKVIDGGSREPYPYLLLTLCYLQTGQFNRADEVVRRLKNIEPSYPLLLHLEGYLYVKGAPTLENVISFYIDLLDRGPDDPMLRRMLRVLRRVKNFSEFQRRAKLSDFVVVGKPSMLPASSRRARGRYLRKGALNRRLIWGGGIALALLVTGTLLFVFLQSLGKLGGGRQMKTEGRDIVDQVSLEGARYNLIEKLGKKGTPVFYYSSDQLAGEFMKAKYLAKEGKYNQSLLLLNRIYHSNANLSVKERVDFLRKFILNVEDREWEDIPFSDISDKSYLYYGSSVQWRGRVANVRRKDGGVFFNLMVDYRGEGHFAGVVDVYSKRDYPALLNGDDVLVRAVFIEALGREGRLYLSAREIERRGSR